MSNNGMILHITAAGRAQRTNARLNGSQLPRFSGWVVDTATTQNVDAPTLQALYTSTTPGETLVERIDDTAIGVRIIVPPTFAGWVRGIALKTEDGTIYAYARFAPENGGMYKPVGTAIRQLLILAEDGRETVEFTYSVVDVSALITAMTDGLYDAAYERLRTAFYATICNITAAPLHEDGDCLEIPLSESAIINTERNIVAEPIKE